MPLQTLLTNTHRKAEELGHDIVWSTIGDHVANGACSRCGRTATIAATARGHGEVMGQVVSERCAGARRLPGAAD